MALPLLAACGGQSGKDGAADGDRSADPGNPATWVLPLQAYMPDSEQEDLLFQAVEDAKAACMARFGFNYRPAQPLPDFGPDTLTDLRYGIHDRQVAETYGYKPAGDMIAYREETRQVMEAGTLTPAEEAVMTGKDSGKAGLPEGGCASEAHRRVYGADGQVSTLAMDLSNEAYAKAKKTEPVRKAFRSWSQCMAKQGYAYDEPLDAPSDPAFAALKAEPAEIATALADLECRGEYRVAEVWFDAETRLQREAAEQHVQELQEAGQVLETSLKAAARTTVTGS